MSRRVLGWVLLTPALVALVWTYALPTGRVLGGLSLHTAELVIGSRFPGELGRSALLAVVPLMLALVVAPAIALAARSAGRGGRVLTRVLIAVPPAGYAPIVYLAGWAYEDPGWSGPVLSPVTVAAAGPVLAVAVTLYLAALREPGDARPPRGPGYLVGAVLALAVVAVALQSYATLPPVWQPDVPLPVPRTYLADAVTNNGQPEWEPALAFLLLLPLVALGLLATGVLLSSRARIEVAVPPRGGTNWLPLVGALVVVAGVVAVNAWPFLRLLPDDQPVDRAAAILRNTWLPPLVSALVSVVVAALGGFAIGALRPLADRSDRLLWFFAPWLFVGVGPLVFAHRDRAGDALGTVAGLIPPVWVSIPALVVFTLFFRGRAAQGATTRAAVLSALPLAASAFVVHWVLGAQDQLWPAVASGNDFALINAPNVAAFGAALPAGLSLALPWPVFAVLLVLIAAVQVAYLDRLAITTARTR